MIFHVRQADCQQALEALPAQSVDLIVTDPAYESLEKHRSHGTTTRLSKSTKSSSEWFAIFPNTRFAQFFKDCYRVLKPHSHLYVFSDAETMRFILSQNIGEQAGFRFWKPLVWDKKRIGMGYHYRARYEFVLFFEKGKRRLKDLGVPDILEAKTVRGRYPTEKPVSISETLIYQSSERGQIVLDPFCGSGSVGDAALGLRRKFIGSDLKESAVVLSRERLENMGTETSLSALLKT